MNSTVEYDIEKMAYRTTFSMSADELRQSYTDLNGHMTQAAAAMRSMSERLEHEAFYGKPQPAPYAGDATFGSF